MKGLDLDCIVAVSGGFCFHLILVIKCWVPIAFALVFRCLFNFSVPLLKCVLNLDRRNKFGLGGWERRNNWMIQNVLVKRRRRRRTHNQQVLRFRLANMRGLLSLLLTTMHGLKVSGWGGGFRRGSAVNGTACPWCRVWMDI